MSLNNDWIPLLRRVSIFSRFTTKQLSLVAKSMMLSSLPKGASLVEENQKGDSLYIIVSGSVQIVKENTDAHSHTKKVKSLAFLNRGDAVGEMTLLTGEVSPYSALVQSTSDVLVLKKTDFDRLLEKYPNMAVHLSRNLSSHLALMNRSKEIGHQPGQIFSIIPAVTHREQILFAINLGVSLVEQTRQKTLLLIADDGSNLAGKSLGLSTPDISDAHLQNGFFQDPKKFDELIMLHPSGLELLSIHKGLFYSLLPSSWDAILTILREHYDYCLIVFPPEFDQAVIPVFQSSNRVLLVSSPMSGQKELEAIRKTENALPAGKPKDQIWLQTPDSPIPPHIPPGNRIPWDPDWPRYFMVSGSPFVPFHAVKTQRKFDRLARYLGNKLIGFAMGSGAAFGYSLIGILRVLEREGIYPDVVSGTSMGALIASFYASGIPTDGLEKIARSITRSRLWHMINLAFPRAGLITGKGILKFLRSHLGDKTFNDLEIPFSCVATDIQTGREIIFEEGNVAQSVRASLSLPFFFQPYYMNGRYLVDGGLVNPVPTSLIMSQGANVLLSANLTAKTRNRPNVGWRKRLPSVLRGPSIIEVLLKTIYTMQYEIAESRAKMAHVVMDIAPQGLWWWDLDQAKSIIKVGEAAAEENLAKIKSHLPYFSNSCQIRLTRRGKKIY